MIKTVNLAEIRNKHGILLKWAGISLYTLITSMGHIMGCPTMLNVSSAVLFPAEIIPSFITCAFYYLIFDSLQNGVISLCSMLAIAVLNIIFSNDVRKNEPVFMAVMNAMVLLLFNCIVLILIPSSASGISIRILSTFMSSCYIYSFKMLYAEYSNEKILSLSGINFFLASIVYISLLSCFSSINIMIINIGRVIGCYVLLYFANRYKTTGGAIVGALTTCSILIADPLSARNTMLLATSGLICGAFSFLGSIAVISSFLAVSLIGLIVLGINSDTFYMFIDAVAGVSLFVIIPDYFLKKIVDIIFAGRNILDVVGQTTSSRLSFASKTLSDIRSQMAIVSAAIDRKTSGFDIKKNVDEQVCDLCELSEYCHISAKDKVSYAFSELEEIALKYNCVSLYDTERLLPECCSKNAITDSFNSLYKKMLDEKADRLRLMDMRDLLSEQLYSLENILSDLSFRINQVKSIDSYLSSKVKELFSKLGYPNAHVCVYLNENNYQCIEAFITAEFRGDLMQLALSVTCITDINFDIPIITKAENITRIEFIQQPQYSICVGTFQAPSSETGYSGDTYKIIDKSSCENYAVLSDGMGTGKHAKLESMFAVSLACRLLKAGISMKSALGLINSILRVKDKDELFTTLDIMHIDMCGGNAEFLKAGASATYLMRDGTLKTIGGKSFPAGIFSSCIPDISSCKLFDNDILIMTSDGVDEESILKLKKQIDNKKNDPKILAQLLGESVLKRNKKTKRDDISIIIYKISLKNE